MLWAVVFLFSEKIYTILQIHRLVFEVLYDVGGNVWFDIQF